MYSYDVVNKMLLKEYFVSNDMQIRDELFARNEKLVQNVLNHILSNQPEYIREQYDDLYQMGCIGLYNAIINFDSNRINDIAFSFFANKCIARNIIKEICVIGNRKKREVYSIQDEDFKLSNNYWVNNDLSDENEVIDEVDDALQNLYKTKKINQALKSLDELERKIVVMYYGFNGEEPLSFRKIAKRMNMDITSSYIEQILASIKNKLSKELIEFEGEYNLYRNKIGPFKTCYVLSENKKKNRRK